MSVWPVCIDYAKDQLYLGVCLTCMYWLYVRSTVPWCLFDLYVLAMRKINSTLRSVWHVCIDYSKDQLYLDVCLTCMYWLCVKSTVPWCLFDLYVVTTKDQLYLDICLTCMYWLYVRSTVPWCLFDLYVLAIGKINSTLMSVWPVCNDYTKDQQYLDVCLTCMYWLYERSTVPWCLFDLYVLAIRKINSTLMSVWPVCIGYI
jgi:hypothetical protein